MDVVTIERITFSVFKNHNIMEQDLLGVPKGGMRDYVFQNSFQPCRFGPKISMDQCISYNGGTTEVYHSTQDITSSCVHCGAFVLRR